MGHMKSRREKSSVVLALSYLALEHSWMRTYGSSSSTRRQLGFVKVDFYSVFTIIHIRVDIGIPIVRTAAGRLIHRISRESG
jgi:hypothetical protein